MSDSPPSNTSLKSDLDYIKSLAEAGGAGPLKNGASLFWAGLLYGAASIGQYAQIEGWLPRTLVVSMVIWFGASIVFGVLAFTSGLDRWRNNPSTTSRASGSAWSAVGFAIVAFLLCVAFVSSRVANFSAVTFVIAPVILLMYGMGWWVSATMSSQKWLKWIAFGCFASAPLLGLMAGMPEELLAYTACLFLFATVPGYILMRAEKA